MPRFSASFWAFANGTNQIVFDIRTSATDFPVLVFFEAIGDNIAGGATPFDFGIGVPSSSGIARPNGIVWLPDDAVSPAPAVTIGTDWTVNPGLPSNYFFRAISTEATVGNPILKCLTSIKIAPSSPLAFVFVAGSAIQHPPRQLAINLSIDA